jgi:hypothetical protein
MHVPNRKFPKATRCSTFTPALKKIHTESRTGHKPHPAWRKSKDADNLTTRYYPANNMKKLPIGIQTFSELIEDRHYYVDKTPCVLNWLQRESIIFWPARAALASRY